MVPCQHINRGEKPLAAHSQARRQRIIDGYLADSGRNVFKPHEFVDWLADQPEHEAYKAFYSISDDEAARAYRIELARRFVSGLRIVVTEQVEDSKTRTITVSKSEAPTFISPLGSRHNSGGYVAYDPKDAASVEMFRKEAAQTFGSWLKRYESALTVAERKNAAALVKALQESTVPA
jgi:hypothetical protein